jgi:hypothetical protein
MPAASDPVRRACLLTTSLAVATWALAAYPPPASPSLEAQASRSCGVERQRVKTLTDPAANTVRFTPHSTTVDALRALKRPRSLSSVRSRGAERRTFRIRARLSAWKLEDDYDIHLVVSQPGRPTHTMIIEFPAARCTHGASRSARKRMTSARRAIERACGRPPSSRFHSLSGTPTITGVGFFDFKHGQRGLAPNAIELHPVTAFRSSQCG